MAARGSAPIGLAFAGLGGILILSGIQGQSLAEIVRGEWGKGTSHELPNPNFTKGNSESGGEGSPVSGVTGESPAGGSANSSPGSPLGKAIPPSQIQIPQSGVARRQQELGRAIKQALEFKSYLGKSVSEHRLTPQKATEVFNAAYPRFGQWSKELTALGIGIPNYARGK